MTKVSIRVYSFCMNPQNEKQNKKIVALREEKGLSFGQIGEELGITKQTAHHNYYRDREKYSKKAKS